MDRTHQFRISFDIVVMQIDERAGQDGLIVVVIRFTSKHNRQGKGEFRMRKGSRTGCERWP